MATPMARGLDKETKAASRDVVRHALPVDKFSERQLAIEAFSMTLDGLDTAGCICTAICEYVDRGRQ